MTELDHWHPLVLSGALGQEPVAVRLAGHEIVLFRGVDGAPAALADRCAHRGMRLSCGKVSAGRLVCPYHGWHYDQEGRAKCPSSPKMTPRVQTFETSEHQGAIWVRARGQRPKTLPQLAPNGYSMIGRVQERFNVPIEPLLDNFSEVEHVPTTHKFFGYAEGTLPDIAIEHEATESEVRTLFLGPSARPPMMRIFEFFTGTRDTQTMSIEAVNRFSPPHVELTLAQLNSARVSVGPILKFFYFFVPVSPTETDLVGFVYWTHVGPITRLLFRRLFLFMSRQEVLADKSMIERLVDTGPSLDGFALTRFDVAVRSSRRLLQALYRGHSEPPRVGVELRTVRLKRDSDGTC
jgi:phenylpropionate dioxygenase-like ring-hydroxylating dioxygenase large terminal subunit